MMMTQRWHGYHLVAGGRARSYYSEQAYDLAESIAGGRSTLLGGYGATVYPTVAWSSINRPPPLLCRRHQRPEVKEDRSESILLH